MQYWPVLYGSFRYLVIMMKDHQEVIIRAVFQRLQFHMVVHVGICATVTHFEKSSLFSAFYVFTYLFVLLIF